MKRTILTLFLIATGLARVASADPLSYNYLDASLVRGSFNGLPAANGFQASGSYGLGDTFFLTADYQRNKFGGFQYPLCCVVLVNSGNSEDRNYRVGAGMHWPLNDTTDLVGRLSFVHAEEDISRSFFFSGNATDSHGGYDLALGVRNKIASNWELDTFYDHDNVAALLISPFPPFAMPENALSVGLRWQFAERFDLALTDRISDLGGKRQTLLSGRWYF